MPVLIFDIPGAPRGKGRPRFSTRGKFPVAYTDKETSSYEAQVKWFAKQAGATPRPEPCTITIVAYFSIPPSWSKKKKAQAHTGELPHTTRPDWDNIGKIICDSLNGIAYLDDKQVWSARVEKLYNDEPRVHVIIHYKDE